MHWQPIETAPKEVYVLLYIPAKGGRFLTGIWDEKEQAWVCDLFHGHQVPLYEPSHWLPIPPLPH